MQMNSEAEQVSLCDLGLWSGKMCPELSAPTGDEISKQSSRKSSASLSQPRPMCLCLKKGNGLKADASTMKWEDGALLGDFTMRSFGEYPSEDAESRLSQILEECPLPKYSLSAKACVGVLRRAHRRGKKLPRALETALKQQVCLELLKRAAEREKEPLPALLKYCLKSRLLVFKNSAQRHDASIYDARGNGDGKTSPTLTGDHESRITDYTSLCTYQKTTGTLTSGAHPGSYNGQDAYNDMLVAHSLRGSGTDPMREDMATYPITGSGVRRLTPLECERLQGYPDGWTDIGEWTDSNGKRHNDSSDSARYKALGNSIALPFWFWLLRRISAQYSRPATLGSLFDGIGGFPLCWERCNGNGTALWASEIDEFPIAVTKRRFGGI